MLANQSSEPQLTKQDVKGLAYLMTADAMYASSRLRRLVEDTPEECLKNNSLLIDTDPRHVGDTPLEELELPGVTLPAGRPSSSTNKGRASSSMKGKSSDLKKDGESKSAVSYMTPEQIVAEEAALQDRILYEMRQNLQKLKEYGKEIGITLDVSKKKSQHGRMQGERWHDDEMTVWRDQATRLVRTPPPMNNRDAEEAPAILRVGEYVFKLERLLNEMRFERQRRQGRRDELDHEIEVTGEQEDREQNGAGKMAEMYGRLSKLKERIQDTDQKILEESAIKKDLAKIQAEELEKTASISGKCEETQVELSSYAHDCDVVKLQLKGQLHEVEKQLGQGKLLTMLEVKEGIKGKYSRELGERNKVIQKQVKIKEMLSLHDKRVAELTSSLEKQYDQNRDSPRRNELKRKAVAFEEVFETMMKRIGESDITRIVQLFQKQALTNSAWTEAVRDMETRVKALQDEKRILDKQLHKLAAQTKHGIANETRQFTISGRRHDMAVERLDNSTARLMQLEGLIAHVKESIRQGLIRLQGSNADVPAPPTIFPHDGPSGVDHWVREYGNAVVSVIPKQEALDLLLERAEAIREEELLGGAGEHSRTPASRLLDASPGTPQMPRKLKSAIKLAGADQDTPQVAGENNTRVPFPAPRLQKTLQDKEREEDEQEARAEQLDETIVSRDEWKRRALRVIKQRDRETAEREAIEKGEESPNKKKKKGKKPTSAKPMSSPGQ